MRLRFGSYRLLLTEEEAAQLRVGSWIGEAEDGALRRRLAALCHLTGWSARLRLLVCGHSCSHGHLREPQSHQVRPSIKTSGPPRELNGHNSPPLPQFPSFRLRELQPLTERHEQQLSSESNRRLDPLGVSCLMLSAIKGLMHAGCMLAENQSRDMLTGRGHPACWCFPLHLY